MAFLFPDGDDRGWSDVQNGEVHGAHRTVPIGDLAPRVRRELERLQEGAALAETLGLECHAGHGLTFDTVAPVAASSV
mgnify:CR=1 FL=1